MPPPPNTPALDARVASLLDRPSRPSHDSSSDEDALISALEEDESSLAAFREQRLQQLHTELAREKQLRAAEHGTYAEIKEEKQLMDITTSTRLAVVHFFKPDFGRCGIMDRHLEALAAKHFDTRFLRINVENAPFLVTKLKVQVLPCVLAFVDGVSVDRIVGFEGLGYSADNFTTRDLEARLLRANVLVRAKMGEENGMFGANNARARNQKEDEDDDDDDWD